MYQVTSLNYNGTNIAKVKNADTLAVEALLCSDTPYPERVFKFEQYLMQFEQVEVSPKHEFIDGMCKREVIFEAGTLATGKVHIKDHMDVMLEGEMLVATEDGFKHLVAPCTMTTKAGTKKAGIAITRTRWISYHPTEAKTRAELEAEMLLAGEQIHNQDVFSYNNILKELGMTQEEVDIQVLNDKDLVDMPAGMMVEVRKSRIHGLGLFSTSNVCRRDVVCPARIANNRTPAGRYTNHSAVPNCEMVRVGEDIMLVALRYIGVGEELTTCYRKTIGDLSCQQ